MAFGPEWFVVLGPVLVIVLIWAVVRAFNQGRRGG
jgi:hypothetical protein